MTSLFVVRISGVFALLAVVAQFAAERISRVPRNDQLQRAVDDQVSRHTSQRAAAEPRH